jgi:hypothetical protein
MAEQQQHREQQQEKPDSIPLEGAVGASDADNGGGAGAGIPDAELVERAGDAVTRGDIRQDREKLFPEDEPSKPLPGAQAGDDADDEPRER